MTKQEAVAALVKAGYTEAEVIEWADLAVENWFEGACALTTIEDFADDLDTAVTRGEAIREFHEWRVEAGRTESRWCGPEVDEAAWTLYRTKAAADIARCRERDALEGE